MSFWINPHFGVKWIYAFCFVHTRIMKNDHHYIHQIQNLKKKKGVCQYTDKKTQKYVGAWVTFFVPKMSPDVSFFILPVYGTNSFLHVYKMYNYNKIHKMRSILTRKKLKLKKSDLKILMIYIIWIFTVNGTFTEKNKVNSGRHIGLGTIIENKKSKVQII